MIEGEVEVEGRWRWKETGEASLLEGKGEGGCSGDSFAFDTRLDENDVCEVRLELPQCCFITCMSRIQVTIWLDTKGFTKQLQTEVEDKRRIHTINHERRFNMTVNGATPFRF